MGSFRTLTTHDVVEILSLYGLTGYVGHSEIAAGTINTNVRIQTSDGMLFLRINEGKTEADVAREANIIEHVAARGVVTPLPLPARSGARYVAWRDSFASLFPWVAGRTLGREELSPSHAEQAGRALASLHQAGADFPDRRPGRYEPDEIARRLASVRAAQDPALGPALEVLGPELEALAQERGRDLPLGLIHGDLFVDNVLYDGTGRLSALLDFEQASWGRLAYDVAVTLLAFCFGRDGFRPDLTGAFLRAYRAGRAVQRQEQEAFGAELRFAACRFAVTRITDVYMRRGQGSPGGKDFNRYLSRLAEVKALWRVDGSLLSLSAE